MPLKSERPENEAMFESSDNVAADLVCFCQQPSDISFRTVSPEFAIQDSQPSVNSDSMFEHSVIVSENSETIMHDIVCISNCSYNVSTVDLEPRVQDSQPYQVDVSTVSRTVKSESTLFRLHGPVKLIYVEMRSRLA